MSNFDFDELIDGEFDFYGADDDCFRLDNVTYEAVEDDNRLDEVRVCTEKHSFHEVPIARVVVEEDGGIYRLIDLHDGHCWLQFGTEVRDTSERSFDTWFVFEYFPKGPGD